MRNKLLILLLLLPFLAFSQLPTTNLTMTAIKNALGESTYNLGNLVTSGSVNPFSRYRTGYLYINSQFLDFQLPRGLAETDPRGTYAGTDKEVYHQGDFRNYLHSTTAPYVDYVVATGDGIIHFTNGTTTATGLGRTVYFEQVNWQQSGTPARNEFNNWASPITHVHLLDVDNSYSILGTVALADSPISNDTYGKNVTIPLPDISIPSAGTPVTVNMCLGFGVHTTNVTFRVNNDNGAGGLGSVTVQQNTAQQDITLAEFTGVFWDGVTAITGADDATDAILILSTSKGFNTNIQLFFTIGASGIETSYLGGNIHHYRAVTGTAYIRGFHENPATEYLIGSHTFNYNTTETFNLPAGIPHTPSEYGDNFEIILYNPVVSIKID